ncbi:MAG: heparinase II/III-family protein [Pelagibacterales bacterium]|nr:heparinase II/III-family protein [Pelagibacterales bacterium]
MILKNSLSYFNQFFFFIFNQVRKFYLNSKIYNNKISKINENNLEYKPSPSLLDCFIKYKKNKKNIEDFSLNEIWFNKNLKKNDYKNLHSFFWLFTLDLNSSKKNVQSVILNWINNNHKYNNLNWGVDILSKRVIAWISNSKITYENSNESYKEKFDSLIQKQINHLINEINRSKWVDDKMIGCAAIILGGLAYNEKDKFLDHGLNLLKKIIKFSFDKEGFPKSRNIRQLNFYLKYFILIREWLKESQNEIPEYLNEIIFHLGQAYFLIHKNIDETFLFNGNQVSKNPDFENYLKRLGYNFKNENNEVGGYILLKNKKFAFAMDLGSTPDKKFSDDYQSGALSFEIIRNNKKLICNSGYFQNYKHQLNNISKTTACHSTLSIANHSSVQFVKQPDSPSKISTGLKIFNKKIISENNYWSASASHDGYNKRFGIIHERKIDFLHDAEKFIGVDKIFKKKKFKSVNFEIRFHLDPESKIMKTQDGKAIYIDLNNEGWKFICKEYKIDVETGLFFGLKNNFTENQNIVISGMVQNEEQKISWELKKI